MAINGYFADSFKEGLDKGVRAVFGGSDVFNEAKLKGGLMGAQTAAAGTKAALDQQKLDLVGRAVEALDLPGLDQREQYNYLIGAANGQQVNPFEFDFKTGTAANKATGRMDTADAALRAIYGDQAAAEVAAKRAQAAASYASAGASNASAAASRAGIDKPFWDSARGVLVHPQAGTFTVPVGANDAPLPARIDPTAKPLPPTAIKMQQENLDAIGLAGAMSSDLDSLIGQMERGELDLGPIRNAWNSTKNAIGMSDEESRNYASLMGTLEKARNDSLRLNKGVQTEGDAVRAWNEMFKNLNDDKVVMQRLREIRAINQRAAQLRGLQNDAMRAEFGHEPMDYTSYMSPSAAVGASSSPTKAQLLQEARDAIAAGAPRDKVLERLAEHGITGY